MRFLSLLLIAGVLCSCNPLKKRAEKHKRNAQNIVSVYSSARAAGSDLSKVRNKIDAVNLVRHGVYGTDSFSTTLFQVPGISDRQAEQAARYITYDTADQSLLYTETRIP